MRPKESVFGSKAERRRYQQLTKTWSRTCNIHHNLPFLQVLEGRDSVSDEEYELLKKTSVDFTVCTIDHDRPLACIEFDGIQDGYNVGPKYVVGPGERDRPARRRTMELKLRIAHDANFPFFVCGSSLFRGLSSGIDLTIVDGVIGEVFASREKRERLGRGYDPTEHGYSPEEFDELPEPLRFDLIEDWAIGIEVESDFHWNPIYKKVHELEKGLDVRRRGVMYPNTRDRNLIEVHGFVESPTYGTAWATVTIPDFQSSGGFISLAHEIARLIALEELTRRGPLA
ncbi:MAG: hypothetical protein ACYDIE_03755 [Candidatus Krumholzibacteriia bacterium]